MKLQDLKIGMQIEDIRVPRAVRIYGIILRIDKNNKSAVSNEAKPVILGLQKGDGNYTEWWTGLDSNSSRSKQSR